MYYFPFMATGVNLRIEVSEEARKALNFEVALTNESLTVCASKAILKGISNRALELAGISSAPKKQPKMPKNVTVTVKADDSAQSTMTRKGPIRKDAEAMKYIDAHMDDMSGTDIAANISRSVASVNKYIKAKREGSV